MQASGRLISCEVMVSVNNALSLAVSAFTLINGEKTALIIKAWRTWRCKVILVLPSKRHSDESPVGARNMQRRRSSQPPQQSPQFEKKSAFFYYNLPGPFLAAYGQLLVMQLALFRGRLDGSIVVDVANCFLAQQCDAELIAFGNVASGGHHFFLVTRTLICDGLQRGACHQATQSQEQNNCVSFIHDLAIKNKES